MLLPRYSDITHGLTQRPARISPKYFYDQHGSQLFEAITRLPEYYPTRTEMALMQTHADSIAGTVGPGRTLIELGAGNCQKARTLCRLVQPACFVGVDISALANLVAFIARVGARPAVQEALRAEGLIK